jgi:Sap, sulfolipid-1-addressing protein
VSRAFLFALTAAFNPTLLAATTVMLLLPRPKRLLLGYLLGATMTSITLGLLIVFQFEGSSAVSTTKRTLSPVEDLAIGGILLAIAYAIGSGRQRRLVERRRARRAAKPKKEPRWKEFLGRGSARDTFVVGALLTLPGGSYLAGLSAISKQDLSTTATVLSVLAFNVIMLALLEIPLLGYTLAPDRTPAAVQGLREWLARSGGRALTIGALVLGAALVARGLAGLLS